jgi:hypothetical protein
MRKPIIEEVGQLFLSVARSFTVFPSTCSKAIDIAGLLNTPLTPWTKCSVPGTNSVTHHPSVIGGEEPSTFIVVGRRGLINRLNAQLAALSAPVL